MSNSVNPKLLLPWGKWGGSGEPILPLIGHMIDTSAVASVIWDTWMSNPAKTLLQDSWGLTRAKAKKYFCFLAGSHDIGKTDPIFQGQLNRATAGGFANYFEKLNREELKILEGLRVPKVDDPQWPRYRHEARSGEAIYAQELASGWSCAAIAGHHGRFQLSDENDNKYASDKYSKVLRESDWGNLQENILQELLKVNKISISLLEEVNINFRGRDKENLSEKNKRQKLIALATPFLSGAIILCDWLASDDNFVSISPKDTLNKDLAKYYKIRQSQALSKIEDWIGRSHAPLGEFSEVFPHIESKPRPAQQWLIDNKKKLSKEQGLTIITIPMGEGKTEIALYLHALGHANYKDSLIFALPTMATANSMFNRVQDFYKSMPATRGHLAHGQAMFNSFYNPSSAIPSNICGNEHEGEENNYGKAQEAGISPSRFFSGAHRALTAPVTVSTCDQVLAAAVSHKYVQLRMASLASKHIILDEVHTYDAYQYHLLERLLGWLGYAGGRVTILTATLPTEKLTRLLKAWKIGEGRRIVERGKSNLSSATPRKEEREVSLGQYPSITTLYKGKKAHAPIIASKSFILNMLYQNVSSEKDIRIEDSIIYIKKRIEEIREINPYARIGVITNTVGGSIGICEGLLDYNPLLLHSRMTTKHRTEKTEEILNKLSKGSNSDPCLVIGTQIIEASLDIDFDYLITEMAPMSSLLQRSGRLWRHSEISKEGKWSHPSNLTYRRQGGPTLEVLVSFNEEKIDKGNSLPYSVAEIANTWRAMEFGALNAINIPNDVQSLVDKANVDWESIDDSELSSLFDYSEDMASFISKNEDKKRQAENTGVNIKTFNSWKDEDWATNSSLSRITAGKIWRLEAQTRLQDTYTVKFLILDPSGELGWSGSRDSLCTGKSISFDIVKEALNFIVPASGVIAKKLETKLLENNNIPKNWEKAHVLVKESLPVPISLLEELGFIYHPLYGLTEKE
jgi:CRISPR-associated endonuclease/helicase Cas3